MFDKFDITATDRIEIHNSRIRPMEELIYKYIQQHHEDNTADKARLTVANRAFEEAFAILRNSILSTFIKNPTRVTSEIDSLIQEYAVAYAKLQIHQILDRIDSNPAGYDNLKQYELVLKALQPE